MGILREFIQWLPSYFFPKICYGCGREGAYACENCRQKVKRVLDFPICPACSKPAAGGFVHPRCRRRGKLDRLISYYHYGGWAKEMMRDAKFGTARRWRGMAALAREMALVKPGLTGKWIIVPVPLHWWRERKRGFNQSEIIARNLSGAWGPAVELNWLARVRYTPAQTLVKKGLSLEKKAVEKIMKSKISERQKGRTKEKLLRNKENLSRRKNVKGAFVASSKLKIKMKLHGLTAAALPRPAAERGKKSAPKGINVILVDDVWTSGATMQECCRVLKKAGADKVWGVTLLRA